MMKRVDMWSGGDRFRRDANKWKMKNGKTQPTRLGFARRRALLHAFTKATVNAWSSGVDSK